MPDSGFSAKWDFIQVFTLLYVAYTVPIRTGFDKAAAAADILFSFSW